VERFRLFLRDRERLIVGRSDFEAEDAVAAGKVALRIFESCSDACAAYELWCGSSLMASATSRVGQPGADLDELQQNIVVETEIVLRDSAWAIASSRRLLAALHTMTKPASAD
jgi:hypothetical protein